MAARIFVFALFALMGTSCCLGGLIPALHHAAYSYPVASSYSAHVVNHAIAAPILAGHHAHPVAVAPVAHYGAYQAYGYGGHLIAG